MNTIEQIKKIAAKHMWDILPLTSNQNAPFKSLFTVNIDGKDLPLLLNGELQGTDKWGGGMAILNPDPYLVEHASATLAFYEPLFKKTVASHCDIAIFVSTNVLNKDGISPRGYQYKARKPKPVDFFIQ